MESKIKLYQDEKFVKFWKREARRINTAKKRIDRYMNPELKYYEVKFCYIHGGQRFKSQAKGIRNVW